MPNLQSLPLPCPWTWAQLADSARQTKTKRRRLLMDMMVAKLANGSQDTELPFCSVLGLLYLRTRISLRRVSIVCPFRGKNKLAKLANGIHKTPSYSITVLCSAVYSTHGFPVVACPLYLHSHSRKNLSCLKDTNAASSIDKENCKLQYCKLQYVTREAQFDAI